MAGHRTPQTIKQILAWADAQYKRTGRWPSSGTGPVHEAPDENWSALSQALHNGSRGLPSGGSIAQLLAKNGRRRDPYTKPQLSIKQILAWADAHRRRTGQWPKRFSGKVYGTRAEKWLNIDNAVRFGFRGFNGGHSLPQLLLERRGVRLLGKPPPLTVKQILTWADAHHRRTGEWPTKVSGDIYKPSGRPADETWGAIEFALGKGHRSLDRTTFRKLLAEHRGVRHHLALPRLKLKDILAWADAHRRRTGKWPMASGGAITGAPGETWAGINSALNEGYRWRGARTTLAHILAKYRNKRHARLLQRLTFKNVLAWADAHQRRTGNWPNLRSGTVHLSSGETWIGINAALAEGIRGFIGGSSLARLLEVRRGVRNMHHLPKLSTRQILKWADAHYKREKAWPRAVSGKISGTGGETWRSINYALEKGNRGMSGGWSLFRFLNRYRHPERGL